MADIKQLERALINADQAGDVEAARTLAAEIQRQRASSPETTPAAARQPQSGERNLASLITGKQAPLTRADKFVKGLRDPIDGGAQLLTRMLPQGLVDAGNAANNWLADKTGLVGRLPEGGVEQQVREGEQNYASRRAAQGEEGFDGYRMLGNVASPVNLAAAARLPATIGAGAAGGAALGVLTPTAGENFWGEKGQQAAFGAIGGAVVPAAIRSAKVLRAGLVDPFTEAGRTKIVGRVLNTSAADKEAAKAGMRMRTGKTPGFDPTAGQAADDAGLASLERTARAIDPAGFGDIDKSQRGALVSALRGIAKTPEDRASAVREVEKNARKLYGEAFKEQAAVTPTMTSLSRRPSMKAAEQRAIRLADEIGMPFNARLEDMQPKSIYAGMRDLPDSRVSELTPEYNPLTLTTHNVPTERLVPNGSAPNFVDIPPVESVPVRDMHTLKMGMDALLSDPTQGIAGREAAALKATRNKLLDQLPESYQTARKSHIEMNRPVNQMDIGQELYQRFVPALADGADTPFKTRADAFAQALRNGDKLAKNVTGLKNATLEGIMEPGQMATLNGVVDDAAMVGAAQSAGRGVGSDTVQKMSMSNLIGEAGLPSWISGMRPLAPAGGWIRTAGDILFSKNDESMRHLLADVLKDPARAVEAMERAGVPPSKYAEVLRMAAQAGAVGATNTNN